MQQLLSRVWFLSQGCKQVPMDTSHGRVRWGHPDGYFLNEKGQVAKHTFAPSQVNNKGGSSYPGMRECLPRPCHVIMGITFFGSRPTYKDAKTGKSYGGICHHLIPDKLDYKPTNLLCWLTRSEHVEADRRQRALRKILPDMHDVSYEEHRRLQDPRVTSDEVFQLELDHLRLSFLSSNSLNSCNSFNS